MIATEDMHVYDLDNEFDDWKWKTPATLRNVLKKLPPLKMDWSWQPWRGVTGKQMVELVHATNQAPQYNILTAVVHSPFWLTLTRGPSLLGNIQSGNTGKA